MNIMTKRGQLDNIVVYEHYCDTTADLANIPSQYTTLGSIALVIHDDNANGLEVYMATTDKEWVPILNGGGDDGNIVDVHICTSDEYDAETGEPTIENPIEGQFYLVPSTSGSASDMFDEWFYTNGAWEKFGSAGTAVDVPKSDWNQNDSTAEDYIKNRTHWEENTFNEIFNETLTFISPQPTLLLWNASTPYVLPNADITAIYRITIGDYTYTAQPVLGDSHNQSYIIRDESHNYNVNLQIQNDNTIIFNQIVIFNTPAPASNNFLVKIEQGSSTVHQIDSKYLPTPNWLATSTDNGYIVNKPNIIKASGQNAIVMNDVQNNSATGAYSIASGRGTVAIGEFQHVTGTYNQPSPYMLEIVGYGTDNANRTNIRTTDYAGNESLAGSLTLGLGTADETTITAAQLKALLNLARASGVSF